MCPDGDSVAKTWAGLFFVLIAVSTAASSKLVVFLNPVRVLCVEYGIPGKSIEANVFDSR